MITLVFMRDSVRPAISGGFWPPSRWCRGAVPLPTKVQAVAEFSHPASIEAQQEFLGMVKFFSRILPRAAHLMHPLYEAL